VTRLGLAISAIDAISPAFAHTKQQLFQPFRADQWAKLALVGLLAGELTTGSCGNFNPNFHVPKRGAHPFAAAALPTVDPVLLAVLIAFLIVIGFAFFGLLFYLHSVMRFILFDSVIAKQCDIQQQWNRRQGPALKYLVWQIGFSLVTTVGLAFLIGVPAIFAFLAGWLTKPKEHIPSLILCGMALFLVVMVFILACAVVQVFTRDFVIPHMALEDLSAFEAWRRLLPMLNAEKGSYFGYLLMKLVMAIGIGIVLAIIATIVILLALVPVGGFGAIAVLVGKAAGLQWNVYTITFAVVVGSVIMMVFFYLIAIIAVPAMVFFPAYSIYFLASRYPRLAMALHPATPIPPPSEPAAPPIPPLPETSG
jgi:hypothetical protein